MLWSYIIGLVITKLFEIMGLNQVGFRGWLRGDQPVGQPHDQPYDQPDPIHFCAIYSQDSRSFKQSHNLMDLSRRYVTRKGPAPTAYR